MKNVNYQLKNVQGHTVLKNTFKGSWAQNDLEDKLQKPAHNAEIKGQRWKSVEKEDRVWRAVLGRDVLQKDKQLEKGQEFRGCKQHLRKTWITKQTKRPE